MTAGAVLYVKDPYRVAVIYVAALACHPVDRDEEQEWSFNNHRVCDGVDPEGNVFQCREPISQ